MTRQAHQMHLSTIVIPSFCFLLLLTSCIMIPVPTHETKILAGTPVTEDQLSFLRQNITMKSEVINNLGNPNLIWEDARVFIYHWEMRQGILFWAVGAMTMSGGAAGGAGMTDIPKHYFLFIQFDEQERVQRFERTVQPAWKPHSKFLQEWLNKPAMQTPKNHIENMEEK